MKNLNAKQLYPRTILRQTSPELNRDNILVILGSRQVGKTSVLSLLYEQIKTKDKIYFDLEDIQLLKQLNQLKFDDFFLWLEEKSGNALKNKIYVFIDEIQYLDHPSSFLKYVFDHYKKIKFIVSGSSSLEIKKKFTDRLTGRKALFALYPLSFEEFLFFKNKNFLIRSKINLKKILSGKSVTIADENKKQFAWSKNEILTEFEEFAVFGAYPKVVLSKQKQEKMSILKEIHSTYVRKDIRDLAEIENINAFNYLIEILASQSANLLNFDELANTLKINRKTLEKYLFLLENTFIVNLVRPFFTNKRKEIAKMPKIFMKDVGMRNALLQNFNALDLRTDKGALIENLIYTELKKNLDYQDFVYFWRTQSKTEVDFVLKKGMALVPIEVKYQKIKTAQIPSGLQSFINYYKPKIAVVITEDYLNQVKFKRTKIYFLPACLV